ncbi:lecithin-cholesterol acyltransferase-like 4 [Cucurbita maxima]|uniref:Lecithin-cholesterol acyltransferase-like 4 n=1 Tax=Cucurbita maxima TaxID=3661 RepID=A0A6J1K629_CUCMA|nr:lecithin-cholesterol acyltransferase-like 4 [Cucurbita maxima]
MAVLLEEIVKSVELWLKLIKKPEPYVDPNLDPVLLVPGVAGSILNAVHEDTGKEERVWVRILGADAKFQTDLWSFYDPSSGETVCFDPKIKIKVPDERNGLYAIDTLDPDMIIGCDSVYYFHDMIVEMTKWGFQEGKTLFGFGYDFRQSNRLPETLDLLAAKLEAVYNASGGKKINLISHSMGGLLVKCFMSLRSDIFEKYVQNWIAIAAPFQGAPGYVTSTFVSGMSFVNGWRENFFISKWSMHQLLIECPSIYELMGSPDFDWQHIPLLEVWREKLDADGNAHKMLESYSLKGSVEILTESLSTNMILHDGMDIPLPFNLEILKWANETREILKNAKLPPHVKFYNIYATGLETPHTVCYGDAENPVADLQKLRFIEPKYVYVDGDGTVPVESAMADGLDAVARIGVPGEHQRVLRDHRLFRSLKHWLKAGDPDPFYDPLNDYVILPTAFEVESHVDKGLQVAALKEEWEIISNDQNKPDELCNGKPLVSSITLSRVVGDCPSLRAEACATVIVHPQKEGKQHVELNALSISVDA